MFTVTLAGLWARKRRLIGTSLAVVLGVAFLAATLVLGDTMRSGFSQAFTDANAGTDVVVRSADTMGSGEEAIRGSIDAAVVDQVAAVPGVRAAVPSSRASPRSSAPTATASAATVRRPPAPTGSTTRPSTPTASPRAAPPLRPDEVVIDRGAAEDGDLAVGDRTTVLTPTPVDVTVVGIATFGDADSLGPTTYTAFTLARGERRCSPSGPTPSRPSSWPPRTGSAARRCATRSPQLLPAHIEALTQSELTAEQEQEIGDDFLEHVRDGPAGLRRHRPRGRHVQHPQHVLDPGRPAHPGVGPAAGHRRLPAPGRRRGRPARRSSSASSPRRSASASGSAWPPD